MSRAPNLLLIMADQMAAPFICPYGGPAVTPALERLAAEGVTFYAYSNSPLCAPARFSMLAGRLGSRIGAYDNAAELSSTVPTFVHYLRHRGYQTSLVGKMHFVGADQLHGYEERLTTDIYPADFGWTPNWGTPGRRVDWWHHNLDSVINAGVADATNQLDFDDDVGVKAIRKLRDLARSSDDRPWFVTVSFTHPHDPYVTRQEFWDLYDHDDIPMPDVGPRPEADLDPHSIRLRHVITADVVEVSDEQIVNARRAYLANCSYVDWWVGRILETLEYHRMTGDTVVVFTADHGDMLGERGLWYKMSFFEHSAVVPLMVWAPGRLDPREVTTLASLVDIGPTLIDLGGGAAPDRMDGASLVPFAEGDEEPERTVPGEYLGEGAAAPIFMLRRGHLKYVWSEPDGAQLFDLAADDRELDNLACDPAWGDVAAAFDAEVRDRWDPEKIRQEVLDSQSDRRTVDAALRTGRYTPWDYQPVSDAANQYMRNHLNLNEVERQRRSR